MTENSAPQVPAFSSWANALRTAVEIGPKVALTAGAICYGLGLLIVSSHLAKLGVYTSDFLKTEYILVGAAFCALTLSAAVAAHYFMAFITDAIELWKKRKYLRSILEFLVTLWVSLYLISNLLDLISKDNLGSFTNWRGWLTIGIAMTSYIAVRRAAIEFPQVLTATFAQGNRRSRIGHWWNLVYSFAFLLACIGVYTDFVYPHLLPQYGGGYRHAVLLIPTADGQRIGHVANLPFRPDGSIGPVRVLLQNEQELTVTTMDDGRAVSLARGLVDAVVEYAPPKRAAVTVNTRPTATPQRR